ncbi:MAG: biotin-dependent carboxyltransferase family protein [Polaribacter sp.]|uniref:5-oxoprolinase subunit C family protein n=1 Tax=Polaribacter sp. TaxID=1920175 RepID=UPI003BAFC354
MLKVLKAGFLTTVQDKGRRGFASIGLPISGAMDSYSADLANTILGNNLEDAVLEITLGNADFQFLEDTIIGISGGDFNPTLNKKSIQLNKRIVIKKNDILSFGKVNYGIRCYLAVKDGFLSEKKLKSRSFYQHITSKNILKKGDAVPYNCFNEVFKVLNTSIKINKNLFETQFLECYKGSEFELLNQQQKEKVLQDSFTISKDNNRMGYQLNESLENKLSQILTSAVLPGTVQLTPSGKLIVLMRDCQVTGGYPRILQLTENAINNLAQKRVNEKLIFVVKNF